MARSPEKEQRILRHRGLKNFMLWFFGFLSSFIITGGAVAIAVGVIPLGTYVKKDEDYFSDEVAKKSLLQALFGIQESKLNDFPIVSKFLNDFITKSKLDRYISVDFSSFEDKKFSEINFESLFRESVKIVATINSLGVSDMLGDLGKLSAFTDWEVVTETVDTSSSEFKPALYYYTVDVDVYERAYDDEKNLVEGAVGQTLYYPALSDIPIPDMLQIVGARISTSKAKSLLSVFGMSEDSIVGKIVGDRTIQEMGALTADEIKLIDVLEYSEENKIIFDILCEAAVLEPGEEAPTKDTLNLGHLENIDIDSVHLTSVVAKTAENESFFQEIADAVGKDNPDDVVIGDVKHADSDRIKLENVLPYDGESQHFYDILEDALGKTHEELTIGDLSSLDSSAIDGVSIDTIVPHTSANDALYNVLLQVYPGHTEDELTVGMLSTFSTGAIKLVTVLPATANNEKLYEVLADVTGKAVDEIVVSDLQTFNTSNIHLSSVLDPALPENNDLYKILTDATGLAASDITLGSISGLDINNIHLSTVLSPGSGSNVLDTLLEDDSVTLGNLSNKLNDLSLYSVYGKECFVTSGSGDAYTKTTVGGKDAYVYDPSGTYFISPDAGIWLIMCFDATTDPSTGRATQYVAADTTMNALETNSSSLTSKIQNTTIYQLIAAGMIQDSGTLNPNLKKLTLQQAIDLANSIA